MKKLLSSKMVIATAVLMTFGAITYACKNFLDQPSQGTLDQSTLSTKAGVEGALIAAYRSLDCSNTSGAWGCAASNWVWGSVTSNDAYKGSELGDQQPINDIETFLWSVGEADGYLNQKWSQVYDGVSRANAALNLLEQVATAAPNDFAAGEADQIKGEALFLRAHYHFEAYRMWGHIPYYFETDTDLRKANDLPLDSIAKLIIADLSAAEALLPINPRNGDKGRITKYGAMAYKGRVQVYAAGSNPASPYWAAAKATFDSVIASNHFGLEAGFNRVWTADPAYRDGKETIFAYQASTRDGEPNAENSNFGERLNFPYGNGNHFTCCGFHQPSYNLVDFFKVDAAGLPLSMSSSSWNVDTTYAGMAQAVDPRLDWTVGRDNVPYKDWAVHRRDWIRDASYSGPYSPKKNIHEQAFPSAEANVGWVATQTNNVPIHLFRYADMLLMDAEADVNTGNLEAARAIVNQVRTRAAVAAQGCGSADSTVLNRYATFCTGNTALVDSLHGPGLAVAPDSAITPWAFYKIGTYNTVWTDPVYAMNAVRTERRLELAMEGQRFFDLRRWGIADTAINNYLATEVVRIPYLSLANQYSSPKYDFYPIPSVQIELSKVNTTCRLQQNPGWGSC